MDRYVAYIENQSVSQSVRWKDRKNGTKTNIDGRGCISGAKRKKKEKKTKIDRWIDTYRKSYPVSQSVS